MKENENRSVVTEKAFDPGNYTLEVRSHAILLCPILSICFKQGSNISTFSGFMLTDITVYFLSQLSGNISWF